MMGAAKELTEFQIREYESEHSRLRQRLDDAEASLAAKEKELTELIHCEQYAARFLRESDQVMGFREERARAQEIVDDCSQRRVQLEPLIQNGQRRVSELKSELSAIPTSAVNRRKTLRELALALWPKQQKEAK